MTVFAEAMRLHRLPRAPTQLDRSIRAERVSACRRWSVKAPRARTCLPASGGVRFRPSLISLRAPDTLIIASKGRTGNSKGTRTRAPPTRPRESHDRPPCPGRLRTESAWREAHWA